MTAGPPLSRSWTPADVPAVRALLESEVGDGLQWSWRPGSTVPGLEAPDIRVGENADGVVVATAGAFAHPCWVAGEAAVVPYLAGLRAQRASRRKMFAGGYAALLDGRWGLTSIGESNASARRLLERGLPGFPRYRPIADLVSFALPVPRRAARPDAVPAEEALLERLQARAQRGLAHRWTSAGLAAASAVAVAAAVTSAACGRVLDARPVRRCRVAMPAWQRAASRLIGQRVPGPGEDPRLGLLAALAGPPAECAALVERLRRAARGLDWIALTLDARDPLAAALVRPRGTRRWGSTLYVVEPAGVSGPVDVSCAALEAAWL